MLFRSIAAIAAFLIPTLPALAQTYTPKSVAELLDQSVRYDAAIPTPEEVTHYQLGQIIFTPDMHTAYINEIAALSERVIVEEIGRSHFGRPILRVTVTSPDNHARLEEIRQTQLSITQAGTSPDLTNHPLVTQITFGVHGSEPSSYDAAPLMLYHLAAGQGPEMEALLDEMVIHLVVMVNPDGANRFAQWTNLHRGTVPVADPQHREHYHEWPWGRTNHYWFDLNRQWLPVTQPEAVTVVQATHDWMPNIAADYHEMGRNSTYFFSPGPLDGLHPLLSQAALDLNLDLNEELENQLDAEGQPYVSEEVFDDFYLGYGSSYPGLLGAIPYLFEQSSVRGIIQETEYGTQRYDDKIGQQARVGLALIRAAQANRAALQSHMRDFFNESRSLASSDSVAGYVFTSADRGRLADFLDILAVHNIEVEQLTEPQRLGGIDFEAGASFFVPTRQDHYRVVKGFFETQVIEGKSEFYDVSGWTQPLAWDLDYTEVRSARFPTTPASTDASARQREVAIPPLSASVGYILEWNEYYAPRALNRFLVAGLRARLIPDPVTVLTIGGETASVERGSVYIPASRQSLNPNEIHDMMVQAAREDGVVIHAARTSVTDSGSDLGGFALSDIEKPEVLLVTGRGVDMYGAGEIWHYLDHQQAIAVSMIDQSDLSDADLDRYTHIFIAHGRYDRAPDDIEETLDAWVRGGGVLVGVRGGASWLISNELSSAQWLSGSGDDSDLSATPASYATIDAWDAEIAISGALFETTIDTTHPLGFGLSDSQVAVHKIGTSGFAASDNPFALVGRYSEGDPLLSGYASESNRERLAGAGSLFAERRGQGSVILIADSPVFRAYMRGSSKLVANALFFGDDFRNPGRRGPAN